MTKFARILVPAALAFGVAGVNAQTIETDYPVVSGSVGAGTVSTLQAGASSPSTVEPFLIQSNAGPVQVNPAYDQASQVDRDAVRAEAEIRMPFGPAQSA
jgi:hypothetical protein